MKTIAIANPKGGTGKSSVSLCLCSFLAMKGHRVLGIDADWQGNFSIASGANHPKLTINDVLKERAYIQDAILKCDEGGYDYVAADRTLSTLNNDLGEARDKRYRLGFAIKSVIDDYDYCIIDVSPGRSLAAANAYIAANGIVAPCHADMFSVTSLTQLCTNVREAQKYNKKLRVLGILITRYGLKPNSVTEMLMKDFDQFSEYYNIPLFKTRIRENNTIVEAQMKRKNIFTYASGSDCAKDYAAFGEEFLKMVDKFGTKVKK